MCGFYIERTPDFGSNWGVGGNSVTPRAQVICDTANQFQTVTLIAVLNLLILLKLLQEGYFFLWEYPDVTKFQTEPKSCDKY